VDGQVSKGAILDATAACATRYLVVRYIERDLRTVPAKAVDRIEDRRLGEAGSGCIQRPVPVWLRATIAALVAQQFFIIGCEQAMPGKEMSLTWSASDYRIGVSRLQRSVSTSSG
jgi:hypothetical protein